MHYRVIPIVWAESLIPKNTGHCYRSLTLDKGTNTFVVDGVCSFWRKGNHASYPRCAYIKQSSWTLDELNKICEVGWPDYE